MLCNGMTLILGILIIFILICIVYRQFRKIKEGMSSNDPVLRRLKQKLSSVHPKVNDLTFFEDKESYTINKKDVYLCLRDENNEYYNENMLIYVTLHEVAHAICDEIGHTQKFHEIFESLLDRAYNMGIYNPSIPIIQDYCQYHNKNE
jgi:hypothetical protein